MTQGWNFFHDEPDWACTEPSVTRCKLFYLCKIPSHYYTNITIQLENNLGEFMAFRATHSK